MRLALVSKGNEEQLVKKKKREKRGEERRGLLLVGSRDNLVNNQWAIYVTP
jgi:hypothetical protein